MSYETALDAALAYAGLGWRVLPVHGIRPDGVCACEKPGCPNPGKHPMGKLVPHGAKDATSDEATIRRWWRRQADANVGIATDGLVVVDVDPQNGGDLSQLATFGDLPATVTAITGSGGQHLFFRRSPTDRVGCVVGLAGLRGIDVRADGGYVVATPSVHVSGGRYAWEYDPEKYLVADVPAWLLDLVRGKPVDRAAVGEPIRSGERNSHLHGVGRALHARGCGEEAILAALRIDNAARCDPPLPDDEVAEIARKTSAEPDTPEFGRHAAKRVRRTGGSPGELIVTDLSTVEPEEIDWLWSQRLARGKVTLVVGDPGTGKSSLAIDIVARITTGSDWPGGGVARRGNVILLNAEDGLADTIRPRVDRQGGDARRIRVIEAVRDGSTERTFSLAEDLAQLGTLIEPETALIVVDPLTAYLGASQDAHRDADVRHVLTPLVRLAEGQRFAVLAIMHLNKDQQKKALYRPTGSIAFTAMARMVFAVQPDRDDRAVRLFVPLKSNLSAFAPGLTFSIDDGRLNWREGTIDIDPETALGTEWETHRPHRAPREIEKARMFLVGVLSGGPVHHHEVKRRATEQGLSERTLNRAKSQLGVQTIRDGGFEDREESLWQLPEKIDSTNSANIASPASIARHAIDEGTAPTGIPSAGRSLRVPDPRKR